MSAAAPFVIRRAGVDDAAIVHAVVIDAWRGTVDERSSGHRWTVADAEALLRDGGALLARDGDGDGQVLGSVGHFEVGGVLEITKLAVRPGARGCGLGPALVGAAEQFARERSLPRTLLAVSVFSPALVPWYVGLGYRVDPTARYGHASHLSPPPVVMIKDLV